MAIIKPPPIAVLTLELYIPSAESLKDKRQVVKSIKERVKAHYNISIAEFGETEKWQTATLAICTVGNDRRKLGQTLQAILNKIDNWRQADITHQQIEYL